MATIDTKWPTLMDAATRTDPDGTLAEIAETLNETNEILTDMVFLEGNLPTGNKSTIRTGLPVPTWRKLYGGVQPTKSTTAQVTDTTGMLEAYAEQDAALVQMQKDPAGFRRSEDLAHVEGMSQKMAETLIYGNETTEPEAFTGLAPRFNSLSAQNADNIVNAGGAGSDNTSMYLVVWGPRSVHGIYPQGSRAGLAQKDHGEVTLENIDGAGGRMQAYRTHFRWDMGLTMRDWRYVAAVRNIDVSDLGTLANTKNLITWGIQAGERIPNLGVGRAAWYVNRTIREKLRLGILEKVSTNLTWETVAGQRVMMFDGIPVRRVDAILNTEAAIS